MAASISRLARAGGDRQAAIQGLLSDPSPVVAAAKAKYANDPAGLQTWINSKINETTKGKYSGVLGKAVKFVSKAAPFVLPLIPGLGVPAAAALSAGAGVAGGKNLKDALLQGAGTGAGTALLGGQGYKGVGRAFERAKNFALGKVGETGTRAGGLIGKGGLLSRTAKSVGGPLNLAQIGLAGANAIQGAQAGSRANAALDRSVGALPVGPAPAPENLSALFADSANPYGGGTPPPGRAARSARMALAGGY